jgi:hypothetical protein
MKTTLSQKKQDSLYSAVHKKCMDARIEVISFLKKENLPYEDVDSIFYKLCASAPKEALRCFEKKT